MCIQVFSVPGQPYPPLIASEDHLADLVVDAKDNKANISLNFV